MPENTSVEDGPTMPLDAASSLTGTLRHHGQLRRDVSLGYLASSFDLLNVAHLDVIDQACARCARLVVGVLPDDKVEELVGRPPVVTLSERISLVGHLRGVSDVVEHGSAQHRALQPDLEFGIAGEELDDRTDVVLLQPRRRTASAVLLAALVPTGLGAVAG